MPAAGFLKSAYLCFLSKPAGDRPLLNLIRRRKISQIVEVGIGRGMRAQRMLEIALRYAPQEVRYTGIDMFEARPDSTSGLTLKQAYKQLRSTGAKVQLVPGDPFAGLARTANGLAGTQLLVISADQDEDSLSRAWLYVPRLLADDAYIFQQVAAETPAKGKFERLTRARVDELAGATGQRRRAA